ncbi:3-hydroxyacyl-CoA dehydrogenase family protein [Salinibacillus xinjiangensis]|uniref:3-hydroxyacyl-CoA dehydrogenase family protein n=1 Tax=Salinibacillus xinjiangensis TaxID=1229268 RepID=A0A6G1X7E7_9BACI|nr:3-hydroxyacyl-CoA dehydrogenase family protein [Salinibacillus xinjiangensis]MRG86800.1 3-hydroxyacyl-CoA dehydrogenase family protein [Salinibacillus xinjiangensis]
MSAIQKVAVIGAGSMGHQIAMLSALGGFETNLQDIEQKSLEKAKDQLEGHMEKWVKKGKITDEKRQEAFERLHMTTDVGEAVTDVDLVIEAVVENLDVKQQVFKQLDQLAPHHAILATNSSTIVNSKLAEVTNRPAQVCNMHYFYPPLVMDCIEVVKSEQTSEETMDAVMNYCEQIGRTGFRLEKEIYGFIANRILFALNKEALKLYEEGYADYKDIDGIVKKALGHPLGPFELMDLSGIDVVHNANLQLYNETGDEDDKPAKSVEEKVRAGEFGRKTGKGWYDYSN